MCRLCVGWENKKITTQEAFDALNTIISTTKNAETIAHLTDLSNRILDEEVPFADTDQELDASWSKEQKR